MDREKMGARVEVHDRETLDAAKQSSKRVEAPGRWPRRWSRRWNATPLARPGVPQPAGAGGPHQPHGARPAFGRDRHPGRRGHIGAVNRWFAGTRYIDEVEALCMELLSGLCAPTTPTTGCAPA